MKVKLEGFRELDRALARLPKATGKNVLRRIARGALEPMAAAAQSHAPRGPTGNLHVGIAVSQKRTKRSKTQAVAMRKSGKWRSDPSTGIEMAMGPTSRMGVLGYASFVEFGTVDTAPQPYMRPAWDGGAMNALEYIKANLKGAIDKAAARLAKKRLKAK